ncbi:MAG: polysaccharide biosynthesis C-terminal domain-containing protein [Pseudobutyrivibrio sp.]|nr:polysaccharide biosynthesis C-terminal domain-containing protein [Pseudobutyrivibrio sp.]
MSKKTKSIVSTTIVITILTMCFKLLGFVKQAVVAYFFGTTFYTDVYYLAFNFVGMLGSAFIRAITISMVSIYTNCLIQKGKDEASKLISACLEILVPVVLAVMLLAYALTPQIAHMLAPDYTPEKALLLQHYLQLCFPFFLFAVVTLVWTTMFDANKDFVAGRTESFTTSVTTILCCIFLHGVLQAGTTLVIAQYCSYVIFGLFLIIRGRRYFKFTLVPLRDVPEIKTVLLTAIPLFIGNSVSQINKIVDGALAAGLGDGKATSLSNSAMLEDFVTVILVNNVVDVLYVNFSIYTANKDYDKLVEIMKKAINIMICIMIPITIVTCICSREIVSIAYERGAFGAESVDMTKAALVGYAAGFASMGIRDIILRGLYSFKNTKTTMITGIISVLINIVLSIVLSHNMGIMGITLASSISLTVNFLINSQMLKRHIPNYHITSHIPVLLKQIPAVVYTLAVVLLVKHYVSGNIIVFLLSAILGLGGYGLILMFMKVEEVDYIKEKLLAKLKR